MTYRSRCNGRKARHFARKQERIRAEAERVIRAERESIWNEAWRSGARRAVNDMIGSVQTERESRPSADGRMFITDHMHFPDPRDNGGYHRVQVPMPTATWLGSTWQEAPLRAIGFRAVQMQIAQRGPAGTGVLRWFNWEPEHGSLEFDERTAVYVRSMSKLGAAASTLEYGLHDPYTAMHCVERAAPLVREAYDELRTKLGRYQAMPTKADDEQRSSMLLRAARWEDVPQ